MGEFIFRVGILILLEGKSFLGYQILDIVWFYGFVFVLFFKFKLVSMELRVQISIQERKEEEV